MVKTATARVIRTDKRDLILTAASRLFAAQGYARVSVDAIAAESGVSKPTIYSYFDGKEGLFREYVKHTALRINSNSAAVLPGIAAGEHWRESLETAGVALVQCQRSAEAGALSRQLQAEVGRDPQLVQSVWEGSAAPLMDGLAGRLAILANAGYLVIPDPDLAARHFFALIGAEMLELTKMNTSPGDDDAVRASVLAGVDTFIRAFRASGVSP